jgi:hypothetical protein
MFATSDLLPGSALASARPSAGTLSSAGSGRQGLDAARHWHPRGRVVADLASPTGEPRREAHLNVSFGLLASQQTPWAARFWEIDPPTGVQPIDWLFDSRNSVTCLEDALELLDHTQGLVTSYAVT